MLHDLTAGFTWADAADKAIRTIAVYGGLLLLLRAGGKRQLAQLNTFDLVVLLLLSNIVQNAVIGNDTTLIGGLVGAGILIAVNFLLVFFVFLDPRLERRLRGRSTVLVEHGRVRPRALRRELVSRSELDDALRRQGYDGIGAVEEVVLEPEGTLAVRAKGERHSIDDILAAIERLERKLEARAGS